MVRSSKRKATGGAKKGVEKSPKKDLQAKEPTEEPPNGPMFQRHRMDSAKTQLLELVDYWENILQTKQEVPLQITEEISSVIGQTRLLTSSKFEQFRGLITNSEEKISDSSGDAVITCNDLDGFWDMMHIQVKQLNSKFENLKVLQGNNWKLVEEKKPVKKIVRSLKTNNAVSHVKEAIRAKRMAIAKNGNIGKENKEKSTVNDEENVEKLPVNQISSTPHKKELIEDNSFMKGNVISSTPLVKGTTKQTGKLKKSPKPRSVKKNINGSHSSSSEDKLLPLRRSARIAAKHPKDSSYRPDTILEEGVTTVKKTRKNVQSKRENTSQGKPMTKKTLLSTSNEQNKMNEGGSTKKTTAKRRKNVQESEEGDVTQEKIPKNFAEINKLKAEKFRRSSFGTIGLVISHRGKTVSNHKV